jgi:hypothetical protein
MPDPKPRQIFLDKGRVTIEYPRLMTDAELAQVLAAFVEEVMARPEPTPVEPPRTSTRPMKMKLAPKAMAIAGVVLVSAPYMVVTGDTGVGATTQFRRDHICRIAADVSVRCRGGDRLRDTRGVQHYDAHRPISGNQVRLPESLDAGL